MFKYFFNIVKYLPRREVERKWSIEYNDLSTKKVLSCFLNVNSNVIYILIFCGSFKKMFFSYNN